MSRPIDWTPEQKAAALEYLLKQRCSNYGYDAKDFKRISAQRSAARNKVRRFHLPCVVGDLHWETVSDRLTCLTWNDSPDSPDIHDVYYVVGQSANEEITNLLRRLVNPDAKWVS